MVKYICAGCNQPIREGLVAVLGNEQYLHYLESPICISLYLSKTNQTPITPRIIPFSELGNLETTAETIINSR